MATLKHLNLLPYSVHPTSTPSIIFQGYKLDNTIPFWSIAAHHYAKRESSISMSLVPKMTSSYILPTTSPAMLSLGYPAEILSLQSTNIPDFLNIPRPQEGAMIQAHSNLQNGKLCSISRW